MEALARFKKRLIDKVRTWCGHKFGFFACIEECEERIAYLAKELSEAKKKGS